MLICAKIKYKISRKFEVARFTKRGIPRMDLNTEKMRETHNLYRKHPWKPQEYYLVNYFL